MKVTVTVKPNSKKGPLVEANDDGLLVYLAERPVEGQANQALEQILAKHFGVAKSRVAVIKGKKSRIKMVEVDL